MKAIQVKGIKVDEQTRCAHYHTDKDIIAIKYKCCNTYYPCHRCHEELADHEPIIWKKEEREEKAILCGACQTELTIHTYVSSGSRCPVCESSFNEGCKNHYHLYFE
ncbi:CHY zinc finger protein [Alkalihalobacillus deserti]|uniref:CHY zinc finger protein n=1 Tax=Alkalihalobacillus deserti TaxID=2879466 RepID=UPI001D13B288|nr:CHY zinc finger protein [Alkalihalobacillus deserti]